ncbi:MAG: hypothetical protein PHU04_05590 [Candidatus Peribacteraceae bacterium]|nr:hypothetical protein [Candidatus Peribacteraceae bacterium]
MLSDIINLLSTAPNTVTVLLTAISLISAAFWALFQYGQKNKDKRFSTYHDLVDQLVNEQRNPDRIIKLDRQIAVVYELRNFKNYFPVSIRILNGFKGVCTDKRIIEEIDLTVQYMESSLWKRFFWKYLVGK